MQTVSAPSYKIAILGSGNVATHLSLDLEKAGNQILFIYSRKKQHAEILANSLNNTFATDSLDFTLYPQADIYFICVSDSAVADVVNQAIFPEGILVVHTSGSLPLSVLQKANIRTGVFYPIQTFTKNQPISFTETPIALEVADSKDLPLLQDLATRISNKVILLDSEVRKKVHLAAVFACNFTNHLFGVSQEILQQHKLPTDLLHPLIQTTLQKALHNNPFHVQTGPAVRRDKVILKSQEEQLQEQPVYQEIYKLLTKSIQLKADNKSNAISE